MMTKPKLHVKSSVKSSYIIVISGVLTGQSYVHMLWDQLSNFNTWNSVWGHCLVATITKIDAISERQKCEDLLDLDFQKTKISTKSVDVMGDVAIAWTSWWDPLGLIVKV